MTYIRLNERSTISNNGKHVNQHLSVKLTLGSGFLLIDEFAELLRQLNIEQLSRGEIKEIFDEINTDQVCRHSPLHHISWQLIGIYSNNT